MKIITICGSYKYKSEMISVYQQLTDLGYIVLFPAMGCEGHDKKWYLELHTEKIAMSDAIFVVDVNHYVGESTKYEISKADEFGKEIIFYSSNKLGVV
ncbi:MULTISPECIES: DUF4406 domain-containing protein [Bacteroides]|uniref:DUF4406 domain-containing protein n=1 Tax=Bacteroides TaxID=816 RepID=UPI0025B355FE|nr:MULTISPECIES: DUF4406 domain-containing protein [Bacteroides]